MDFATIRRLLDVIPMVLVNKALATLKKKKATLEEEVQTNQLSPKQVQETSASINILKTKVAVLQKQKESFQRPLDNECIVPTYEEFKQTAKTALPIIMEAIITSACDFVLNFKSLPPQEKRLWWWEQTSQICRLAQVDSIQFKPGTHGGEMKCLMTLSQQPATLRPAAWSSLYDPLWDGERTFWNEQGISKLVWLPRRLKLGTSLLGIAETQQVYEALGTLEGLAYATAQSLQLSFEPLCSDEEAVAAAGGGDTAIDKDSSSYCLVEKA
jgi:hypothetical protein